MTQPSPYFIRPAHTPDSSQTLSRPNVFDEDEGRIDVLAYWHIVLKHLRLIAVILIAVVMLTALRVFMMDPVYTSSATLLLKPGTPAILSQNGVPMDSAGGDDYYENFSSTQLEILKSRTLAAMVIKNDGLDRDPAFTGVTASKPKQPGLLDRLRKKLNEQIRQTFPGAGQIVRRPAPRPHAESSPMGVNAGLIDMYLGELEVGTVSGTSLVRITFHTPDPQLSAKLANAHAHAYIREGVELHSQANEEAEKFLQQKLVELKEKLEKSEIALNAYRREKGIVPGEMTLDGKETVVLDRVSELSKDLTKAQVDRIGLEAQVQQITSHNAQAISGVVGGTSNLATLQGQLSAVDAEYASLAKQFKPEYPPLVQLTAKRQELMSQINIETRKALDATNAAYAAARAKEDKLQSEMEKQRNQALNLNDAAVEYAILQREVDTNRELYNSVLQRMKDVGLAAEARASNIFIVDSAEPAHAPSAPRRLSDVLRNAMLALAGGVGLAFLLEYLNNTLKTPEEVERYLKVPNLAVIPAFARAGESPYGPVKLRDAQVPMKLGYGKELVGAHGPNSLIGESYRSLRTALMLSRAGAPPKTILFTSATNSEGKTVTASNTAVMFAHTGARVVLIDADLRRPRCHKILAMDNHQGLTEALTGARELGQLVRTTGIERLSLLSSGSFPPNPTELLASERMRQILDELTRSYDMVVIDSPPIMPVSDGLLLSTMVDGVVLVVNSEHTARQQSRAALARLDYARAKIFGVVLNNVNVKSPDYRFYQNSYYSHYSRYDPDTAAEEEGAEPEEMI